MLLLDHNLTAELWRDSEFWAQVPWALSFREEAEVAAFSSELTSSALTLKHSRVYNQWKQELLTRSQLSPESLQALCHYICARRKKQPCPQVILPGGVILCCGDFK